MILNLDIWRKVVEKQLEIFLMKIEKAILDLAPTSK